MSNSSGRCQLEPATMWIWIRTTWNFTAIIVDIMLLNLLFQVPNVLSGCFDKLYISTIIADLFANIARVLLRYFPIIFCHHIVFQKIEEHLPLATTINATEWYLSYVMICTSVFFNIDHAFLVIFSRDYIWMCNNFVKWIFVILSWFTPLIWVLPMINDCCQSTFISDSMQPIFKKPDVEDIYDSIDMTIETFFYIPVIFMCNFISIFVLHHRYKRSEKVEHLKRVKHSHQQAPLDIWQTGICENIQCNMLPPLNELKVDWCAVGDAPGSNTRKPKKGSLFIHQRIAAELNMSLVNLIDQIFDAVGVLFYLLFWGGLHNWIDVNSETVLFFYDICWELGTTTQPLLLLLICHHVRHSFFTYYAVLTRFT